MKIKHIKYQHSVLITNDYFLKYMYLDATILLIVFNHHIKLLAKYLIGNCIMKKVFFKVKKFKR